MPKNALPSPQEPVTRSSPTGGNSTNSGSLCTCSTAPDVANAAARTTSEHRELLAGLREEHLKIAVGQASQQRRRLGKTARGRREASPERLEKCAPRAARKPCVQAPRAIDGHAPRARGMRSRSLHASSQSTPPLPKPLQRRRERGCLRGPPRRRAAAPQHGAEVLHAQLLRAGLHREGAGLVEHVDGPVGQAPAPEAARERHGGLGHARTGAEAVVLRIARQQAAQHLRGGLRAGLRDLDDLEAPLEGGVPPEDQPLVLLGSRRANAAHLAARQDWLQEVGGVHGVALRAAGADEEVQLVDKEHQLARGSARLCQEGLQALLEVTTQTCARQQGSNIQGPKLAAVAELRRHLAGSNPLRHSLNQCSLAHTRRSYEAAIAFRTPREDLQHPRNLRVPSKHWVKAPSQRLRHQVHATS
mmetsp:Transcript_31138/g.89332  ORF Transcript_31138/g.89332 Transcript_31138/m.89332 type:complete len:417 (-) Transcript_31138:636-1886(-)